MEVEARGTQVHTEDESGAGLTRLQEKGQGRLSFTASWRNQPCDTLISNSSLQIAEKKKNTASVAFSQELYDRL